MRLCRIHTEADNTARIVKQGSGSQGSKSGSQGIEIWQRGGRSLPARGSKSASQGVKVPGLQAGTAAVVWLDEKSHIYTHLMPTPLLPSPFCPRPLKPLFSPPGACPPLPLFSSSKHPAVSVLCFAVLCCAMLCHAVPCCAVLCRAVPCCAMLCHAVPRHVEHLTPCTLLRQKDTRAQLTAET